MADGQPLFSDRGDAPLGGIMIDADSIDNLNMHQDARLIAAAPDLLEALKALWEACILADEHEELSEYVDGSFLDDARAAIAKAEGEGTR
jgi:hypothetical protein